MNDGATAWRFIDTPSWDGAANMAMDEALLASFDPATSPPVFRLYGWSPPAFSLGRFQDAAAALDLERCREAGVGVVRRVTAGGIIYHAGEVTYSIVCGRRHIPGVGAVKESFRRLCGFLLLAYQRLGLDAGFAVDRPAPGERLGERTALCFAGREEYDIVVHGRKLGGNAQRRTRDIVFQHGSVPLRDSLPEAVPYLNGEERATALGVRATSLAGLGVSAPAGEIRALLRDSFAENFGVSLESTGLEPRELEAFAALRERKYSRDGWNLLGEGGAGR